MPQQHQGNYLSVFTPPSRGDVERELALVMGTHLSDVGVFGAHSDVTVPSNVTALFSEISQTIQSVLRLASVLMTLSPTSRTVETVRECRRLALSLQEELETRRGR